MSETITPKRKKAPRRKFKKEMEHLQRYCEVYIDVLSQESSGQSDDYKAGKIIAFKQVLVEIGRINGK